MTRDFLVNFAAGLAVAGVLASGLLTGSYLAILLGMLAIAALWAAVRYLPEWRFHRGKDFAVTLQRERWDVVSGQTGRILEVDLRVKNRTNEPKRMMSFQLQTNRGGGKVDAGVEAEAQRRRQDLQMLENVPSRIDARQTVSGWLVYAFPYVGGEVPQFVVSVRDELGETYKAWKR